MEVHILTVDKLLDLLDSQQITQEQLWASTYNIAGNIAIRLFNSKEYLATVPALLPSLKVYKHLLGLTGHRHSRTEAGPTGPISYYSNISPLRADYKDKIATTNRKTDLIISNPPNELPWSLTKTQGIADDNNSAKL